MRSYPIFLGKYICGNMVSNYQNSREHREIRTSDQQLVPRFNLARPRISPYFETSSKIVNKILLIFRIDRSAMIHNVRPYARVSVRPSVTYNLPNRNRYEKNVITKKLRIDENRCNEELFFQKSHFFGLRKIISRKTRFFLNQNR